MVVLADELAVGALEHVVFDRPLDVLSLAVGIVGDDVVDELLEIVELAVVANEIADCPAARRIHFGA